MSAVQYNQNQTSPKAQPCAGRCSERSKGLSFIRGGKMDKIQQFAKLLEEQQVQDLIRKGYDPALHNVTVTIKPGRKYTKVDVGTSGKYMVENSTSIIYGIKAYGVIHRGHWYGTLDTVEEYDWSGYYARKKSRLIA